MIWHFTDRLDCSGRKAIHLSEYRSVLHGIFRGANRYSPPGNDFTATSESVDRHSTIAGVCLSRADLSKTALQSQVGAVRAGVPGVLYGAGKGK